MARLAPAPENDSQLLHRLIESRLQLRFSVTAAQVAHRIEELAAAAGVPAPEYARQLVLPDLYLAMSCAAGDRDAWSECDAAHFAFIRAFARRFLPDAAAQDLADQVIADLWQRGKIGRYAGRSTLRTWLGAVVAHAAMNARKGRLPGLEPPGEDYREFARQGHLERLVTEDPERSQSERLLSGLVVKALAQLEPEEKLLLQLYYEQGLTLDEMERPLRTSKATLSRRLKRIRERLKSTIDRLAADLHDTSAAALREHLALGRVAFDLSSLLRGSANMEGKGSDGV
jgi:RNA polymerase sigma factor (sigma-70 family)